MKSQTLAVSVVLLLIAVATLPGLSFSLSSSVTSYNNSITINGGITFPSNSDFYATNVDDFNNKSIPGFDSAYEIASGDGGFCGGKPGYKQASFTIPKDKTFIINVKIDHYYGISGFSITINLGDGNPVTANNINGGFLNPDYGSSVQGYLCEPGKGGSNKWHIETGAGNAKVFSSTNGNVVVTVNGLQTSSTIHFYIIFIKDQEAGT